MALSDVGALPAGAFARKAWPRRSNLRMHAVRAAGATLFDARDRPVLDAAAAFAGAVAGHCRREVADAVHAQLSVLAGVAQAPRDALAAAFAERLGDGLPDASARWVFAESVNDALGAALSVAFAWQRMRGEIQRTVVISNDRAAAGASASAAPPAAGPMAVAHLAPPWLAENRFYKGQPEQGADEADELERLIAALGAHTVAACVIRPLAVAQGVHVPPAGYLERIRMVCDAHDVLLCFDETLCSAGRFGDASTASSLGVTPDLLVLGDEWTNGAQPFAAVAMSDAVWAGLGDGAHLPPGLRGPHALHPLHTLQVPDTAHLSHTSPGWAPARAAGCAAALATLELFEREQLIDRAASSSPHFLDVVFSLSDLPVVTDIRGYGLAAGIDLCAIEAAGPRTAEIQRRLWDAGLNVASCGDTLMLAPPLAISAEDIDSIGAMLRAVLSDAV
jgi:beta-alanine--pyruvate transaminase